MDLEKQSPLQRAGMVTLFGPVDDENVGPVIEAILNANLSGRREPLRLWVNSPGGNIDQGFALLDIMRWSRLPIATCGLGLVGSMGLMLVMAGAPGMRTLMPSTDVLSHRFAGITAGSQADLLAQRHRQDLIHQRIINHYQHCTQLDVATIEEELLLPHDRWFSAAEAVALGLADRVWNPVDEAAAAASTSSSIPAE